MLVCSASSEDRTPLLILPKLYRNTKITVKKECESTKIIGFKKLSHIVIFFSWPDIELKRSSVSWNQCYILFVEKQLRMLCILIQIMVAFNFFSMWSCFHDSRKSLQTVYFNTKKKVNNKS